MSKFMPDVEGNANPSRGPGTSTLSEPYPRPKTKGEAGVTTRPSSQWIVYGMHRHKREKKMHTKRAAELRMKLRQVIRAWHTFVESNRLYRQQCLTDILVRSEEGGVRCLIERLLARARAVGGESRPGGRK